MIETGEVSETSLERKPQWRLAGVTCRAEKLDVCLPEWIFEKIEAAGIRLQSCAGMAGVPAITQGAILPTRSPRR